MSEVPKYQAILETIKREILQGKYDHAMRFPSEWQLTRRFGVSRPTVSRALHELEVQGVLKRRKGSGSTIDPSFRSNARFLGMLVPDYTIGEFFQSICSAFAAECSERGYTLLYGTPTSQDPSKRLDETLELTDKYIGHEVAGVIFEPADVLPDHQFINENILHKLEQKGIKVVFVDRDLAMPPARSDFDLVGIDNVAAGNRLAKHILEQGAKRIAFISRKAASPYTAKLRIAGVARAYADAGLRWDRSLVQSCEPEDIEAIRALFARRNPPDAVIGSNDATCAALIKTLNKLKISVPDDVLLGGFDDLTYASMTDPSLTTIHQPCDEIGRIACRTLIDRINNPETPPRQILLDAPLVVRESTSVSGW